MASSTQDENKDDDENPIILHSRRPRRMSDTLNRMIRMKEARLKFRAISNILKKNELERTSEEISTLEKHPDLVEKAEKRATMRCKLKTRIMEIEDPSELLKEKCDQLAEAIKKAKHICVYTGAGISTAASIPDYRGPNGVWTLLRKGQQLKPQELTDAEPTKTHMSLVSLYKHGKLKHVVSQNCDGLHLRSGLSKKILSEVHGNMYLEMCFKCKPHKEYVRLFDVTEKTSFRRHHTARNCHQCKTPLNDTIVHFGEKGRLSPPYRWKEATSAAKNCDIILCLGTSLKVLKKYTCLWSMNKKPSKRPKLFIVNLQWTPKDDLATLKINGKCDEVMERVMNKLKWKITDYTREKDPLFRMAVPLRPQEYNSVSSKQLQVPDSLKEKFYKKLLKKNSKKRQEPSQSSTTMKRIKTHYPETSIESKNTMVHKKVLNHSGIDLKNNLLSESSFKDCQHREDDWQSSQLNSHNNNENVSYDEYSSELLAMKTQQAFDSSFSCWPVLMVLIDHDYLPHEQFWTLIQAAGISHYQKLLSKQIERTRIHCQCSLTGPDLESCDCYMSPLNPANSDTSPSNSINLDMISLNSNNCDISSLDLSNYNISFDSVNFDKPPSSSNNLDTSSLDYSYLNSNNCHASLSSNNSVKLNLDSNSYKTLCTSVSQQGSLCCVNKKNQPGSPCLEDPTCVSDEKRDTYPASSAIDCKPQNVLDDEYEKSKASGVDKKSNKRVPGWFGRGLIVHKKRKRF